MNNTIHTKEVIEAMLHELQVCFQDLENEALERAMAKVKGERMDLWRLHAMWVNNVHAIEHAANRA